MSEVPAMSKNNWAETSPLGKALDLNSISASPQMNLQSPPKMQPVRVPEPSFLPNNSFQESSYSMSASHEISANCLRKCTSWQLQLNMPKEKFIKHQYLTIEPNSGIALK